MRPRALRPQLKRDPLDSTYNLQVVFDNPRRLFDRYFCKHLAAATPGFDENLAQEVRVRLCQVHALHDRILALERDMFSHELRGNPPDADPLAAKFVLHDVASPPCDDPQAVLRPFTRADEMRVLLESFYYNASRIRDLFRDSDRGLPGLRAFESTGIRDVRNHLVEHPTRKRGVKVMAIGVGGPIGPQLKPMRRGRDPAGTWDAGLSANAQEFCSSLESTLKTAVGARAV